MVCGPGRLLRTRLTLVFAGPVAGRLAKGVLRQGWERDAFFDVIRPSRFGRVLRYLILRGMLVAMLVMSRFGRLVRLS